MGLRFGVGPRHSRARLCSPGEFRRRRGGTLPPNSRETWLDVEARAVYRAFSKLVSLSKEI